MNISNKLTIIDNALANIKTSIINKGQIPSGDITTYANAIENISSKEARLINITIDPSINSQNILPSSEIADGFNEIYVNPVTNSIDNNIKSENIKKNIQILGITGTYEGSDESTKYGTSISTLLGNVNKNGVLLKPSIQSDINFEGVITIGDAFLQYKFYITSIKTVIFPDLISVSAGNALSHIFYGCKNLSSVIFSNLSNINGSNTFEFLCNGCSYLTTFEIPNLTTISGNNTFNNAFTGTKLSTINFSNLENIIASNCFNYAFSGCKQLAYLYFNKLTDNSTIDISAFSNMFNSYTAETSGTCELHFPLNAYSKIAALNGYPTFGGDSNRIIIIFDLPIPS